MREKITIYSEKTAENLGRKFEKLDIFLILRNHNYKVCFCFYVIFIFFVFLLFITILTGFFSSNKNIKDFQIMQASNLWDKKNSTDPFFLSKFAFKIIDTTNKGKLFPFSLIEKKNGSSSYGFSTSYHYSQFEFENYSIPNNMFQSNNANLFTSNSSSFCLELLRMDNKNRTKKIKFQPSCINDKNKGLKINLWKIEESIIYNKTCDNKLSCKEFCEKENLLYNDYHFILDSLKNDRITCLSPLVINEICAVIAQESSNSSNYRTGCYNGSIEKYIKYDFAQEINKKIDFFIRDEEDPYLMAMNYGTNGEIYLVKEPTLFHTFNIILILDVIIMVVLVLIGFFLKYKRSNYRDVEMEEFNQHEMSSSSIKL